ncbi:MAG TPA: methyltransferase domain-containing protein [Candidatus Omnitrophota bacterium]|nr:methyltransferase domain-containing protein [Candidatus Omnitrophota bacterium]
MKNRFKVIKEHFDREAAAFDELFFKVMPRYEEMMQALIDALPFGKKDRLKIIDLGCGTGNLSKKLISAYPNARIDCVDMAGNMIKIAKAKLKGNRNVAFWLGDIRDFDYKGKYDCIVASMVLHHVEGKDKPRFYRKLYNSLSKKGVFFCIDIFLSSNLHLQKLYMDKWKAFMKASKLPVKKTDDMIARHQREDRPVILTDELAIMHKAGFKHVDVILKHYNFAVYGGKKY